MPGKNDYIPWPVRGNSIPRELLPKREGDVLHDGLVSGLGVSGAALGSAAGNVGGAIVGGALGGAVAGPPGAAIGARGGSAIGGFGGAFVGGAAGAWLGHGLSRIDLPDWLDRAPPPPPRSRPHTQLPRQERKPSTAKDRAGQAGSKTASAREQAKAVLSMSDEEFSRIPGRELDRILRELG